MLQTAAAYHGTNQDYSAAAKHILFDMHSGADAV